MGMKSFKSEETNEILTLPNLMTAGRFVGGIALGGAMATNNVDPAMAVYAAGALIVSDAEGIVISLTNRFKRVQKALRILPSIWGRVADPIADKVMGLSVFAGGLANGAIPPEHALPILVTEAATAVASGITTKRLGEPPEVSRTGTYGMVARCGVIAADLTAFAMDPSAGQNVLETAATGSAGAAVILGSVSCYKLLNQQPSETVY